MFISMFVAEMFVMRLLSSADELTVGAIIVGSRNPNIQTHLLGSEAASIVRYAHVPVFVIR